MTEFFQRLFEADLVSPAQAYHDRPEILWLHVISDALAALAYLSILIALVYFLRNREALPHRGAFVLLGCFVLACVLAHLIEVWSLWHATFRLVGIVKAVAAVLALATAIMVIMLVPRALVLPAPGELDEARSALDRERSERERERQTALTMRAELERQLAERGAELKTTREESTAELSSMSQLHELGARLLTVADPRALAQEIVSGMITLQKADFGALQLYDPETGAFEVMAHQGFGVPALEHYKSIAASSSGWESVLQRGESVIIEDVLADPGFQAHWAAAASAGFRALQITPLVDRNDQLIGRLWTHFRQARRPSERDLRLSLLHARHVTRVVERQRAEAARTSNDLHLRQLISGLKEDGIFMLDPTGRIVLWNEGAERILGFAAQEILGKHFSTLFDSAELEAQKPGEVIRRAVAEGRFEGQGSRTRKDGSRFWASMVLTPLNDSSGNLQGLAGVVRDRTERKRVEDDLRRTGNYLAQAQKLSHTGSWGWNVSSGELYWSQETFRMFAVNPRDVKPSHQLFLQFVHRDDRAEVERAFEDAKRNKTDFSVQFRVVLPDGSTKHIKSLGAPIPETAGLAEFAGAIVDVSEQKRAEEALVRAQAGFGRVARLIVEEYATSISREISTSLEAIASNGDFCYRLAEATRALPFEAREPLLKIVQDANHASAVLTRVRENIRIPGREKMLLETRGLVLDVLALCSRELKENRVLVETQFAEDLPEILGDRVELQEALFNLVVNAIEAMKATDEERRVLTVGARAEMLDGHAAVRIDVRDYGSGFSPEEKERVFNAFYSTKTGGMGMGLQISRAIVEAHGGRLTATANVGPGATFTCTLPAGKS